MSPRDLLASEALGLIPKILTLQDRNRLSPTYGCFDRNFWHYKIIDFPSGMAQEFVWPLALAYSLDIPGNPYHQCESIREWVRAGILYAAASAHADGSCDDYFPFEKAGGAAAFSLLASAESYRLLDLDEPSALGFFTLRADWLAHHNESGQLTNHQALIVCCLDAVADLTGITRWRKQSESRLARVLEWQNPEGWFQEYEGCDPGYHTLTISLLALIYQRNPSPVLQEAIVRAIRLAAHFIHPDGSFGGEYASRNTYNYFPHGFELFGRHFPEALAINDAWLKGTASGLAPCHADDHILGHHAWNMLLAWKDFVPQRTTSTPTPRESVSFPQAGLSIRRDKRRELYLALNKGGVFRFFRDGRCIASDTGVSLRMKDGRIAVTHLIDHYGVHETGNTIEISGTMGWAKQKSMTPLRLIALRLIMLCGGRFHPDLVRSLLQKLLITGKKAAPFRFTRRLVLEENGSLRVQDRIDADSWNDVERAAIGCDQTSIYVVMSRTFQAAQLQPWTDLTHHLHSLQPHHPLLNERVH
jgi:hypothetical protein